ncbi:MAG TPA: TrbI/VirB10 family protein [Bryobacteraceae bacterium]
MAEEPSQPPSTSPEETSRTSEPPKPQKPVRPIQWGLWGLVAFIAIVSVTQYARGGAESAPAKRQETAAAPITADEQQIADFQKQQQAEAERLKREQQQAQAALENAKKSYQALRNPKNPDPPMSDPGPQPVAANDAGTRAQAQSQTRERRRRKALDASMIAVDFSGRREAKTQSADPPSAGSRAAAATSQEFDPPNRGSEKEAADPAVASAANDPGRVGQSGALLESAGAARRAPTATRQESDPPNRETARQANYDPDSATGPLYLVLEGTVLECVLTNQLDGEYTGPVNVMLTTAIWNHDRSQILIPQGTRLLGQARRVTSQNQRRLAVSFDRMIMPDGFSYNLDQFVGLNQQGATGLSDKVNHHYLRMFGAAVAVGGIGGLAQIGGGYGGFGYDPGTAIRSGIGQEMGQESMQILDRFLNVLPTITIREGTRVRVWLTQDIALPAYAHHTMSPALEAASKAAHPQQALAQASN